MAMRLLGGALAGAVALMLWGFAYWVLLGAPGAAFRTAPDEDALRAQLREALPQSGVYLMPTPGAGMTQPTDATAMELYRQRYQAGPIGMLFYTRDGRDPLSPGIYWKGLAQAFGAALVAALLLTMALPALPGYAQRMSFVFGLGIFAVIAVRLYDPIWWHLPWSHAIHMAAYQGIGWFVAAVVLAAVIRPQGSSGYSATDASKPLWKRALDVD